MAVGNSTISVNSVLSEVNSRLHRSIRPYLEPGKLIPDPDDLCIGDVILTRPVANGGSNRTAAAITALQANMGHSAENARWTHVCLYIGEHHLIEANVTAIPGAKPSAENFLCTGVRVTCTMEYASHRHLCVLRHPALAHHPQRFNVARYGLMEAAVNPRYYDVAGALISAVSAKWAAKHRRKRAHKSTICTEFALECLVMGGTVLEAPYRDIATETRFIYPADFLDLAPLEQAEIQYRTII